MTDERQALPVGRMTEEEQRNYNQERTNREVRLANVWKIKKKRKNRPHEKTSKS